MESFIDQLPKVELHVHLEGTLSPELMFQLAAKHNIPLPYSDVSALESAYQFDDLNSFLALYYQGCDVLRDEEDFYQLTWQYLQTCVKNHVLHCEVFFDPQIHIRRGVSLKTQLEGMTRAFKQALNEHGITHRLILCFVRHLPEKDALETLAKAEPYLDQIDGIGLDSSELPYPPRMFKNVFARAAELRLHLVAHAGEEAGSDYIREAIDTLNIARIDHGISCVDDPVLIEKIIQQRLPMTMCPLSNLRLHNIESLDSHPVASLLRKGACVTINSDDPAYFGGDISDNFKAIQRAHSLTHDELCQLSLNAIEASFADSDRQAQLVCDVMNYMGHDDEFVE